MNAVNFPIRHIADLGYTPPALLVEGSVITGNSIGSIIGRSGDGKTFIALEIAFCVAAGIPYHGQRTKKGAVIFIIGEGLNSFALRVLALCRHYGIEIKDIPLFVSSRPAVLLDVDVMDAVRGSIFAIAEDYGPPALVVFDTLNRNFGGGDENSTLDMTTALAEADKIRLQFQACILFIHHTGHGDRSRGRGSGVLRNSSDFEYLIEKDASSLISMTCTKAKDFEPPEPLAFRLQQVPLGLFNEDGGEVSSAVPVPQEYTTPEKTPATGHGKNQAKALEVLQELNARFKKNLDDAGRLDEFPRVSVDAWQEGCSEVGIDRRRFNEVKKSLASSGKVFIDSGGYAYVK